MTTVKFDDYQRELQKFAERHKNESLNPTVYNSMPRDNCFRKDICWEDGAMWCEVTEKIWEHTSVCLHDVDCPVFVAMWRTEYWNSDGGRSKFCYQSA